MDSKSHNEALLTWWCDHWKILGQKRNWIKVRIEKKWGGKVFLWFWDEGKQWWFKEKMLLSLGFYQLGKCEGFCCPSSDENAEHIWRERELVEWNTCEHLEEEIEEEKWGVSFSFCSMVGASCNAPGGNNNSSKRKEKKTRHPFAGTWSGEEGKQIETFSV